MLLTSFFNKTRELKKNKKTIAFAHKYFISIRTINCKYKIRVI